MKFNGLLCLKHQDLCLALIKYLIQLAIYISNFAELKSENVVGSLSLSFSVKWKILLTFFCGLICKEFCGYILVYLVCRIKSCKQSQDQPSL